MKSTMAGSVMSCHSENSFRLVEYDIINKAFRNQPEEKVSRMLFTHKKEQPKNSKEKRIVVVVMRNGVPDTSSKNLYKSTIMNTYNEIEEFVPLQGIIY